MKFVICNIYYIFNMTIMNCNVKNKKYYEPRVGLRRRARKLPSSLARHPLLTDHRGRRVQSGAGRQPQTVRRRRTHFQRNPLGPLFLIHRTRIDRPWHYRNIVVVTTLLCRPRARLGWQRRRKNKRVFRENRRRARAPQYVL